MNEPMVRIVASRCSNCGESIETFRWASQGYREGVGFPVVVSAKALHDAGRGYHGDVLTKSPGTNGGCCEMAVMYATEPCVPEDHDLSRDEYAREAAIERGECER